ncbi:MAG: ATP-binding protein [Pseudomonadota bacterium]
MNMESVERKHPPELLSALPEICLNYFADKNLIVSHPAFDKTLKAVKDAIDPGLDQNMVNLVGPSGIGKTALTKLLVSQVNEKFMLQFPEDKISVPAAWLEADMPEEGEFEWKYLYMDLLQELHAPLIESTLPLTNRDSGEAGIRATIAPEASAALPTTGALRRRAKTNISSRNTRLIVIDEAKSLFVVNPNLTEKKLRLLLERKAETVRSLVNRSPATLLLTGTFTLLDSVNLTGPLARRGNTVYFSPYEATAEGFEGFAIGLLGLLAHIPTIWKLNVQKMLPILFEQALGQIGMTRHILHKWMRKSLQNNCPMDENLLISCFFPKATLRTLRDELTNGKRQIDQLSVVETIKIPSN